MKWIIITATIISSGVLVYFYNNINKNVPSPITTPVSTGSSTRSIQIIHSFKDGEHRFIGSIRLSHSCHSVNADTIHNPKDMRNITIELTTKDNILDQPVCAQIPTNYPFEVLAEAPEDITLAVLLNNEQLTVREKKVEWQSAAGTYINPLNK